MRWIWLAAVGVGVVVAVAAFAAVLLRRHHGWVRRGVRAFDGFLGRRFPSRWAWVRRWIWGPQGRYALFGGLSLFVLGGFLLFAAITDSWMDQGDLYALDRTVNQTLSGALSDGVVQALRLVTHAADFLVATVLSLGLAMYFWLKRQRWRVLELVLAIGVGEGVLWGMKVLFARERPGEQLASAVGKSFPSGHSFTAAVLYGFLIYLVWRVTASDLVRGLATTALGLLILAVALSRVLLSVHWVSDVLGGLVLGLAWLVFSLVAARILQDRRART